MEKIKLTKRDIDKVIPPLGKNEAIKQSERYEKEYEESKRQLEELLKELEVLKDELRKLEEKNR